MPLESVSLTDSIQMQAALSTTVANATTKTSQPTESFENVLASATENKQTEVGSNSVMQEKPCMAQFMVMTGCDAATASKALYQYENWKDYLTSEPTEIPDLSAAQGKLASEVAAGSREINDGVYGKRNDFVKPEPYATNNPGEVVPAFDEQGNVSGVGMVTAGGELKTVVSLTDNDGIMEAIDGFHIGRQALDSFAQKVTGDETASYSRRDLEQVKRNFLSRAEWESNYGIDSSWNGLLDKSSQKVTNESQEQSLPVLDSLTTTSSYAQYGAMLTNASNLS